jgi:hypothetical protein
MPSLLLLLLLTVVVPVCCMADEPSSMVTNDSLSHDELSDAPSAPTGGLQGEHRITVMKRGAETKWVRERLATIN